MNLSMSGELAVAYKSNSQRARVVTEAWGEQNLYCPNCSSSTLTRLGHNTQASDFSCPKCKIWFQLKGQQNRIGSRIMDGAYEAMMRAIRTDVAPSYYFMHYDSATWTIRNLLLVPHFAFPPSAIVRRNPLSGTARRAGWVGCNFALDRIPSDARISIVTTFKPPIAGDTECIMVSPPEEVRAKFRRIKPLQDLSVTQRGWTLDVLNIVGKMTASKLKSGLDGVSPHQTFTNADVYAYEHELEQLHPDNRHVRDKIRQQLQVLRDAGFLASVERGVWEVKHR